MAHLQEELVRAKEKLTEAVMEAKQGRSNLESWRSVSVEASLM